MIQQRQMMWTKIGLSKTVQPINLAWEQSSLSCSKISKYGDRQIGIRLLWGAKFGLFPGPLFYTQIWLCFSLNFGMLLVHFLA